MRALSMVVLMLISGCGIEVGLPPARPQEAVAIRVYTRAAHAGAFTYAITSQHAEDMTGEVTADARATCFYAGGDWELAVHDAAAPNEVEHPFWSISSDNPSDTPVDIWISVEPDGGVDLGRGVPVWWTADRQECR